MGIEIDIISGDAGRSAARPLLAAVWPPQAVKARPWGHLAFAHADLRVMIETPEHGVACHVGITRRAGTWNGRKVLIGGIGGVATREDCRGRGYATLALNAAVRTLHDEGGVDFGMLFCEAHLAGFCEARGWQRFDGDVYAEQPGGRARLTVLVPYVHRIRRLLHAGTVDLCGLPW